MRYTKCTLWTEKSNHEMLNCPRVMMVMYICSFIHKRHDKITAGINVPELLIMDYTVRRSCRQHCHDLSTDRMEEGTVIEK